MSKRQEIAPEILVAPGTSLVSEIMYTAQKKTILYKNNCWVGDGEFQYHYAYNIVPLLQYIAY